VYNSQGEEISAWVGTNDTPQSGEWSPSNNTGTANMVEVKSYQYDNGGGGTTWADAASVANDTVLEQVQTVYDADSNPIETIDSQRFHNATGTGPLGSPTSGIGARVYYAAEYYNNVDQVIADVNPGTNGGTAWTRPSSVPASSATLLVTNYAYSYYDLDGPVVDVHDGRRGRDL
jgi:hypothetical protein